MGFLHSFKGRIIFVVFADLTTAVRIDNERFALRGDDPSHDSAFVQSVATALPGTTDAADTLASLSVLTKKRARSKSSPAVLATKKPKSKLKKSLMMKHYLLFKFRSFVILLIIKIFCEFELDPAVSLMTYHSVESAVGD